MADMTFLEIARVSVAHLLSHFDDRFMLVENDQQAPFRVIDFGSAIVKGSKILMDDYTEIYAPPEAPVPDGRRPVRRECVCARACACVGACVCTCACVCSCVHMRLCARRMCVCVCAYACICTCICVCVCVSQSLGHSLCS